MLKRFLATPMRKSQFLASVLLSRLLFMVTEMVILLVFVWLAFGVTIQGSIWTVSILILVGAMTFSGIGLLVASRAQTLEAVSGLMNLVMLPMWVLSGIFFSSERFPDAAQPFIKALPLTPLNRFAACRDAGRGELAVTMAGAVPSLPFGALAASCWPCAGSAGLDRRIATVFRGPISPVFLELGPGRFVRSVHE